jgi:methylisocitrate lyase
MQERSSDMKNTPGQKFRVAMTAEKPLQVVGTVNAYVALMAQQTGYKAIYLSGAGVANSSYGMPDLAVTTLDNVLEDVRRITATVELPLLVDIDTGWGNTLMIARTIKLMIHAGAAAVHIEDQVMEKRCGHRPGKRVVPKEEMVDRIKAAVDAKTDNAFIVMARCDSLASEGLEATIDRALAYRDAGADMLFPEAFTSLEQFKAFKDAVKIPIVANITEFGKTPLFTREELANADVDIALYPLTVNRAMNKAACNILEQLRKTGTQKNLLDQMQTREELYHYLDYFKYEQV